uniref:Uncharacterized protein n=1 Tax=Tanacetum cinerariifolium TaxID=118510 RepID=A0A699HA71_TANCI|nr:hypothetical protein [Tanacetum cinerariifolium]
MIFDGMVRNVNNKGSKFLVYPRQYSRRARIAQSSALPTAADEHASLLRDVSQGKAFLTVSSLGAGQDKENIIKSSAFPHDPTPRVTSLAADEGRLSYWRTKIEEVLNHLEKCYSQGEEFGDGGGSRVQVVSVPLAAEVSTIGMPTGSGMVPTSSPIFTTASVVTPYSRRKGKEKMVESNTLKKKKLQEQINIHVKEELQMLIERLDRNNETIAKYLQEYEQFAVDLSIREKIDMINELVKYQDYYAKGMTLEEIREKFIPVWKQIEDFVPMASKEEGERVKRKGLRLEHESAKKVKTSEEVSEEDLKEMMQLVPVEEVYVEALQLWTLVKETLSIRQATSNKEKELWVELKRLYEPDFEDQLDQEIFMLVKKDNPLRKGLAIVMIRNKLQVENYSQMANDLILKIHKIANSPRQRDD